MAIGSTPVIPPDTATAIDTIMSRTYSEYQQCARSAESVWQIPEDVPLFTMLTVSKAAEVPAGTLRMWFLRGHISLAEGDTPAHSRGAPNKFTLRSVLMLTVTAELVRLGSTPGEAFKCASHWMQEGVVEGQIGAPDRREAGGLFAAPRETFLVVGAESDALDGSGFPCRIEGVDPHDAHAHSALFGALFFRGRSSAKIVWLNMIDRRVRQACYEATLGQGAPPEPDWEAVVANIIKGEA